MRSKVHPYHKHTWPKQILRSKSSKYHILHCVLISGTHWFQKCNCWKYSPSSFWSLCWKFGKDCFRTKSFRLNLVREVFCAQSVTKLVRTWKKFGVPPYSNPRIYLEKKWIFKQRASSMLATLAGAANERSERGRSALFKNPLFFSGKFLGCYIEAAQNFFRYVPCLSQIGHKKLPSLNWF